MGLSAHVVQEALLSEDLCGTFRVDIVKEARDVKEEEGPHIAGLASGLDLMHKCGDGIDGVVLWS